MGAMATRHSVGAVVVQLVAELTRTVGDTAENSAGQPQRRVPALAGRFRRVVPDDGPVDVRLLAARGRLRLLAGMIRANRPWRLIFGLTGALVAALATGVYVVVISSIWQLADRLGPVKLVVAMVFALAAIVTWLILDHHLWERPSDAATHEEEQLYNASTLATLIVGVTCLYAGLFVVITLAAGFLIDPNYFQSSLGHPVGWSDYLNLAWFASSLALVAGALGSGFDSEDAVRQAAYSFRERERREALAEFRRTNGER
jgi:hypothetical protein